VLTKRYPIDAFTLNSSIQRVARFRNVVLTSLRSVLAGYAEIAQPRWLAWLRKQKLDDLIPTDFSVVLRVVSFADWLIFQGADQGKWDPVQARWV
jgi:hypothetical protein